MIAPQSSPSTTIGLATADRMPIVRASDAVTPAEGSSVSNRAERPVSRTSVDDVARVERDPLTRGVRAADVAEHGRHARRPRTERSRRHRSRRAAPTSDATARNDLLRAGAARHERRDPPQRGLLVGEPLHVLARLGVRDGRRHELGEGGDPRLGIRAQGLVAARRGHERAPELPLDEDRRADRRAQPQPLARPRRFRLSTSAYPSMRAAAAVRKIAGDGAVAVQRQLASRSAASGRPRSSRAITVAVAVALGRRASP